MKETEDHCVLLANTLAQVNSPTLALIKEGVMVMLNTEPSGSTPEEK